MMAQPDYLPLVRMIIAEAPRFPQLSTLFFSTVTQQGLAHIKTFLQTARDQQIIADIDLNIVAETLLGGLLTYVITNLMFGEVYVPASALDHADAVVDIIIRALRP